MPQVARLWCLAPAVLEGGREDLFWAAALVMVALVLGAACLYVFRTITAARSWVMRRACPFALKSLAYAGIQSLLLAVLAVLVSWLWLGRPTAAEGGKGGGGSQVQTVVAMPYGRIQVGGEPGEASQSSAHGSRVKVYAETLSRWRSSFPFYAKAFLTGMWGLFYWMACGRDLVLMMLAYRFLRRLARVPARDAELTLLPSRSHLLDRLEETLREPLRRGDPGPLIGLKGSWGAGKSILLWELRKRLERPQDEGGTPANGARFTQWLRRAWGHPICSVARHGVVWVDVWAQERRSDIHAAILEAVLQHPEVLRRGHRHYPLRFFAASGQLSLMRGWLRDGAHFRFTFFQSEAGANVSLDLPWQDILKRVTYHVTQDPDPALGRTRRLLGCECFPPLPTGESATFHIVVILDELDRACPEAAQAAVVLARRALEEPGITGILPFVPEQLHYKVFNPVQTLLPDLGATLEAILEEETLFNPTARQGAQRAFPETLPAVLPIQDADPVKLAASHAEHHRARLQSLWSSLEREDRLRLERAFSEKYIAHALEIEPVAARDLAFLLTAPPLAPQWNSLMAGREAPTFGAIEMLIQRIQRRSPHSYQFSVPRRMIGRYLRLLGRMLDVRRSGKVLDEVAVRYALALAFFDHVRPTWRQGQEDGEVTPEPPAFPLEALAGRLRVLLADTCREPALSREGLDATLKQLLHFLGQEGQQGLRHWRLRSAPLDLLELRESLPEIWANLDGAGKLRHLLATLPSTLMGHLDTSDQPHEALQPFLVLALLQLRPALGKDALRTFRGFVLGLWTFLERGRQKVGSGDREPVASLGLRRMLLEWAGKVEDRATREFAAQLLWRTMQYNLDQTLAVASLEPKGRRAGRSWYELHACGETLIRILRGSLGTDPPIQWPELRSRLLVLEVVARLQGVHASFRGGDPQFDAGLKRLLALDLPNVTGHRLTLCLVALVVAARQPRWWRLGLPPGGTGEGDVLAALRPSRELVALEGQFTRMHLIWEAMCAATAGALGYLVRDQLMDPHRPQASFVPGNLLHAARVLHAMAREHLFGLGDADAVQKHHEQALGVRIVLLGLALRWAYKLSGHDAALALQGYHGFAILKELVAALSSRVGRRDTRKQPVYLSLLEAVEHWLTLAESELSAPLDTQDLHTAIEHAFKKARHHRPTDAVPKGTDGQETNHAPAKRGGFHRKPGDASRRERSLETTFDFRRLLVRPLLTSIPRDFGLLPPEGEAFTRPGLGWNRQEAGEDQDYWFYWKWEDTEFEVAVERTYILVKHLFGTCLRGYWGTGEEAGEPETCQKLFKGIFNLAEATTDLVTKGRVTECFVALFGDGKVIPDPYATLELQPFVKVEEMLKDAALAEDLDLWIADHLDWVATAEPIPPS